MGQVLHGSATTTEAVRRAIQHSQASLRALGKRYGINQKTVAKWKRRETVEGKLYLYVAIDRTSKFAFVQLVKKTGRTSASAFLEALIAAVPYKIQTVLTDNGIQFTFPPRYVDGPTARYMTHMFAMRCRENGILGPMVRSNA